MPAFAHIIIYVLSTDTKPTNLATGTVAFEIDTGYYYIWDGTSWSVSNYTQSGISVKKDLRSAITATDAAPITIATAVTNSMFLISACFTDVGATPSGTDTYKITWTDWGSNARNITLSAAAAANLTQQGSCVAQVKAGTNVQVQITAIGTGSSLNVSGAAMLMAAV